MAPVIRHTPHVLGWSLALALTGVLVSLGVGTALLYEVFHTAVEDILRLYGVVH
jgi:hypothetical protein